MTFSQILSALGILAPLAAAVVVVVASFRTSAARVWREEAEAQKQRADRLASDLTEIKNRLSRIEAENARLIQILTSLDPQRLSVMRIAAYPEEN
jgi:Fe-S cluster assembly scaffold protein SufB